MAQAQSIAAGDTSPTFSLVSSSGKSVSLRDFAGKKLVLYFYPKDSTPGCTREAQAFSSQLAAFRKAGAEVVGVSKDSVSSHCAFRDKYRLKVPLLSDPDLVAHKAFGAYGEKVLYGRKMLGVIRSTFLIDEDGTIARAWRGVKVDGHAEAVLAAITGKGAGQAAAGKKKSAPASKATAKKPARKPPRPAKRVAAKPARKLAAKPAAKKPAKKRTATRP